MTRTQPPRTSAPSTTMANASASNPGRRRRRGGGNAGARNARFTAAAGPGALVVGGCVRVIS